MGRRAWLIFAAVPQLRHATQVPIPKYTHEAALEVELDGFDTDLGLKSHVNVDICNIYVDTRSIKINRRIHIFALTEVVTVWYRAPEILLGSVGLLSAGWGRKMVQRFVTKILSIDDFWIFWGYRIKYNYNIYILYYIYMLNAWSIPYPFLKTSGLLMSVESSHPGWSPAILVWNPRCTGLMIIFAACQRTETWKSGWINGLTQRCPCEIWNL